MATALVLPAPALPGRTFDAVGICAADRAYRFAPPAPRPQHSRRINGRGDHDGSDDELLPHGQAPAANAVAIVNVANEAT